jgi:hypothetical protein
MSESTGSAKYIAEAVVNMQSVRHGDLAFVAHGPDKREVICTIVQGIERQESL